MLLIVAILPVAAAQNGAQSPVASSSRAKESSAASRTADRTVGVTLEDGRLSVNVQDRSLERLADAISGKAGMPIVLADDIGNQPVSVKFQNLPLDEGLRQILKKYDAFFFYGVDEQESSSLKAVWVYAKGKGRGVEPVPPEKWASTKELEGMLTQKDPEARARAIEALVERNGGAAQEELLKSLEDADAQVRTQALYAALQAGTELPEGLLNNLALNDTSPEVRLMALQALADTPSARDVAESAANDPSEPVRVQAHQILTQLDLQANGSQPPQEPSAGQQNVNQPQESH